MRVSSIGTLHTVFTFDHVPWVTFSSLEISTLGLRLYYYAFDTGFILLKTFKLMMDYIKVDYVASGIEHEGVSWRSSHSHSNNAEEIVEIRVVCAALIQDYPII